MNRYLKILIPLLFALAIALGILQRKNLSDFSFGSNTKVTHFTTSSSNSLKDYFEKAESLGQQNKQSSNVSFLAVGDIMLSRNVATVIAQNDLKQGVADPPFIFRNMEQVLKSTDFNFGNLESPFTKSCAAITGGHSLIFGAACNIEALNYANFKVLNLANNHAFDQGLDGLIFTRGLLNDSQIKTEGTGKNLEDAWQPAIVEKNGIKICFVGASYSSINDGGKTKNEYVARIDDIKNLKLQITNSKLLCSFVVATMHAGTEYTRTANKSQIDFAHAAIDLGADMVIGAHPHWIQNIERYAPNCPSPILGEGAPSAPEGRERLKCGSTKYIFYSLGNFVFDQNWSQETKEGLTLKITVSKNVCPPSPTLGEKSASGGQRGCTDDLQGPRLPAKLESIELLPIIINNSQPRPATAEETKKILKKIGESENILK